MRIGEISRRSGFSVDTIRWYEKIGLIRTQRTSEGTNNYRNYSADILERLAMIKMIKSLGFTLKETGFLLQLDDDKKLDCAPVEQLFESKMRAIDRQIQDLQQMKDKMTTIKCNCEGDCKKAMGF